MWFVRRIRCNFDQFSECCTAKQQFCGWCMLGSISMSYFGSQMGGIVRILNQGERDHWCTKYCTFGPIASTCMVVALGFVCAYQSTRWCGCVGRLLFGETLPTNHGKSMSLATQILHSIYHSFSYTTKDDVTRCVKWNPIYVVSVQWPHHRIFGEFVQSIWLWWSPGT